MGSPATAKITSIQDHKLMKEEKANYGFMKFPNWFVDERLSEIKSFPELKVIVVIFRRTVGFQKKSDVISYSQFQKVTGMTATSISDGLRLALEHGYIRREPAGQAWAYSLEPLALGYELDDATTSPRLVEPLAPGECFDEKPLAPGYTQKKVFKDNINKRGEKEPGAIAPTPQKSITIDLEETFFYPGYQPETVPDLEPISPPVPVPVPPPTSQQEAHAPYPAPSPPKTSKKVKGVSSPVAGGVEKPKKEKEVDPRCEHPTVKFYQKQMHYSATGEQLDLLTGEDFDFEKLSAAMKYWRESGYFKGNVRGVIDTYHKRSFENGLPGNGNRNDRGRSMGGTGSARSVTTNGAAAKANADYWNRPAEEIEREWAEFKL